MHVCVCVSCAIPGKNPPDSTIRGDAMETQSHICRRTHPLRDTHTHTQVSLNTGGAGRGHSDGWWYLTVTMAICLRFGNRIKSATGWEYMQIPQYFYGLFKVYFMSSKYILNGYVNALMWYRFINGNSSFINCSYHLISKIPNVLVPSSYTWEFSLFCKSL